MIDSGHRPVRRSIGSHFQETVAGRRVTVVTGPRQAGKTTLITQYLAEAGVGEMRSLDDIGMLDAAMEDPIGFTRSGERPLAIDEIQLAGDSLVRAVKAQVDKNPAPGQFILAGSSNFLTVSTISESLVGRAAFVEIWPFTQGEIAGKRERFIDALLENPNVLAEHVPSKLTKTQLLEQIVCGGFPEVQQLETKLRPYWFRDYVRTTIERDIMELSGIRKANELEDLLRLFAARTACELVMQNVIDDSDLERQAVYDHRRWLETVYLTLTVPAWSRNLTNRVKHRPKTYISDPGLVAWLLGKNANALANPIDPAVGQLVETFVATELRRQLTWCTTDMSLSHFRDRNGAEIDLVLESYDGRVIAIEVKASETARRDWFQTLKMARDKLGDSFVAGIALYAGQDILSFGDRLFAASISTLWEL